MALLKRAKGRNDGAYTRLFGDPKLGHLLSRVQSAVISAGTELEQVITELARTVDDVDAFLQSDILEQGVFVATKKKLKESKVLNYADVEPDFLVFERIGNVQRCYLIELKDGDAFDTKKAAGEKQNLVKFMTAIAPNVQFTVSMHVCFFHSMDRASIVRGFKNKITVDEALTGREFCSLLGIDYDAVLVRRKEHQKENLKYFVSELLSIDSVRHEFEMLLGGPVE